MTNPEPKIHLELLEHFEAVSANAAKRGRLEALLEVSRFLTAQAQKSRSVIEIRTLNAVVQKLSEMA